MNNVAKVVSVLLVIIMVGCQGPFSNDKEGTSKELDENKKQIAIEITANEARFAVDDLMKISGGHYEFDELHRTLTMTINQDEFYLIDEIPVLERNGEYLPTEDIYLISEETEGKDKLFLPIEFIEMALGIPVQFENEQAVFVWQGSSEKVGAQLESKDIGQWDVEQLIEHLSFLEKPLNHAEVSKIPGHLPGALRAYRNGFHEGIDWYGYATGGDITTETPIYAMGEGVVVRADHEFKEYESPEVRDLDLSYTTELGETPEYMFDRLRGRQVWIQYQGGVMNRFAHLSGISDTLQVGDRVNAETVIGYVGNSGTSGAVNQDSTELHLHQDLLIYGELFWKPLSQEEVVEVLEGIWE